MAVGSAFGALTELIERLEATDREVLGVATEDIATGGDDSLVVDLSVRTALFGDVDVSEIELTTRSASVNDDGTATVDLAVSIPRSIRTESTARTNGRGGDEDRAGESSRTDNRQRSTEPVHRDPDRLREVYATCDTFTEMTEALGADVTSVTVRRNMIKHGIHEPRSNGLSSTQDDDSDGSDGDPDDGVPADATPSADTSPAADDGLGNDAPVSDETSDSVPERFPSSDDEQTIGEEESTESADEAVAIPDGIGFPHDLTLDRLTEVVGTSKTLHEAQTQLGLDRDRTRELLSDLGVLDLVHGRMSTRHERAASPEEIDERIRDRLSRTP